MPDQESLPDGRRFANYISNFLRKEGNFKNLPVSTLDSSNGRVSIRDVWHVSTRNKAILTIFAIEMAAAALFLLGGIGYVVGEGTSLKALSDAAKPVALLGAGGVAPFIIGRKYLSTHCSLDS